MVRLRLLYVTFVPILLPEFSVGTRHAETLAPPSQLSQSFPGLDCDWSVHAQSHAVIGWCRRLVAGRSCRSRRKGRRQTWWRHASRSGGWFLILAQFHHPSPVSVCRPLTAGVSLTLTEDTGQTSGPGPVITIHHLQWPFRSICTQVKNTQYWGQWARMMQRDTEMTGDLWS